MMSLTLLAVALWAVFAVGVVLWALAEVVLQAAKPIKLVHRCHVCDGAPGCPRA